MMAWYYCTPLKADENIYDKANMGAYLSRIKIAFHYLKFCRIWNEG